VWLQTQPSASVSADGSVVTPTLVTTGFAFLYPSIALHAVCRDPDAFVDPCVFAQLTDGRLNDDDDDDDDGDEGEEEGAGAGAGGASSSSSSVREVRFHPRGEAFLDPIYNALSECAALHPDADGDDDDDGEGGGGMAGGGMWGMMMSMLGGGGGGSAVGGMGGDGEGEGLLSPSAAAQLERLDAMLQDGVDGRFDDAEEGDEDEVGDGGEG
jgi:hypothetical protein